MKHFLVSLAGLAVLSASLAVASPVHAQGCSGDLNGDGRVDGTDLATVLSNWGTCPAAISSVSPAHGSTLGGTIVTITGSGLAATTSVTVGGAQCTGLTVLSPTQLRAVTPPGTAGQAPIAVTTPAGTSLAPTPFNYVLQSVESIVPASGSFSGGTSITISGQYLAGTTSVTIGGVPATNVVSVNATTVTAVTPPGSVGAADVVVTSAKGTVTVPGGFTYNGLWYTVLAQSPDPAIVTSAAFRSAIIATGHPWRVRDNQTQIEMLLIPPGTFSMGCSASTPYSCGGDEYPVHEVTLTGAFYLGRYEVTQAQWTARMDSNPSHFLSPSAQVPAVQVSLRPVEQVSWNQVQSFLAAGGLRLPTEAEWEYAYRAGTQTAFHAMPGFPSGTNDGNQVGNIAWFPLNSDAQTRPVGTKAANGFGVHDMSGNVWEWCQDWYAGDYYQSSPASDPLGPTSGTTRVFRGGSWFTGKDRPTYYVRSSMRGGGMPDVPSFNIGFRVARSPR